MFTVTMINLKDIRDNKYEREKIKRFSQLTNQQQIEYVEKMKKTSTLNTFCRIKTEKIKQIFLDYDFIIEEEKDKIIKKEKLYDWKKREREVLAVRIIKKQKGRGNEMERLIMNTIITPCNRSLQMEWHIEKLIQKIRKPRNLQEKLITQAKLNTIIDYQFKIL